MYIGKEREARIELLKRQVSAIEEEIFSLTQQMLAEKAVAPIGGIIEWGKFRGRVTAYRQWIGDEASYVVTRLLKNGGDGICCTVYPFHHPRLAVTETPSQT